MIKINLAYKKRFPQGGSPKWVHEFKLFDDTEMAKVIEKFIEDYKNSYDHCGYHKYHQVTSIERI